MNRSFPRSVVLGVISPKFVLPSSNAHHLVLGMPWYDIGVGTNDSRVRSCGSGPVTAAGGGAGSASTLYQSSRPW